MTNDRFIIIGSDNERYILYFRASSTYEVVSAVDSKESIIDALRLFCHKFSSKIEMERYLENYQSSNTSNGIIYREYNKYIEEQWNIYKDIWGDIIDDVVSEIFPAKKFKLPKRKFKMRAE